MKMPRRRRAEYSATLVFSDEPQVILLKDKEVPIVAVAIPDDDLEASKFFATTVTKRDWQSYMDGSCDLRYLFAYPTTRHTYTLDLNKASKGKLMLEPFFENIPEDYLPQPRFFSSYHTEKLELPPMAPDEEVLYVDGEWDMPEFGNFYQRYSEVYAFIAATKNWTTENVAEPAKKKIAQAFLTKPFQGGFSYVHFFKELGELLLREQRLGLDKIQYASPGKVEVRGETALFSEIEGLIPNFLARRGAISKQYGVLHQYLSQNRYLAMSGESYPDDKPVSTYINQQSAKLAELLGALQFDTIQELTGGNALVTAKIVMAFYRRVDEASAYFAQGRVSFINHR